MNKILQFVLDYRVNGSFLLALLSTIVIGMFGNILVNPKKLEKAAIEIDTSAVAAASASGPAAPAKADPISTLLAGANVDNGKRLFAAQCASCHTAEKGGRVLQGPNLWNVVGAAKGTREGFTKYSTALQNSAKQAGDDGKWGYENLNQLIASPAAYMRGTAMSYAGMRQVQGRADVVAFLRTQADSPVPLP
jgi:cytochrome c